MTDNTQPDAGSTHIIRYALEMGLLWIDGDGRDKVREALDALDTLETQLEAIGAGGVSGPLIGQPQAMPDLSALTERGAKAWAGVDAQGMRDGVTSVTASAGSEPVAYALFAKNGNIRVWTSAPREVQRLAAEEGLELSPIYTHPSPPEGVVGGWMPIAEAPKDGTLIVLGARNGVWLGKYVPVYQSGFRPENPWSSMLLNHDHMAERYTRPTHWMPLPKAPAPPASEAKERGNG